MRQGHRRHVAVVSTLAVGARLDAMPLKFATSGDCQTVLRRRKGLAKTKLGLDKDLTPTQ
jgi:hypothetical protein